MTLNDFISSCLSYAAGGGMALHLSGHGFQIFGDSMVLRCTSRLDRALDALSVAKFSDLVSGTPVINSLHPIC